MRARGAIALVVLLAVGATGTSVAATGAISGVEGTATVRGVGGSPAAPLATQLVTLPVLPAGEVHEMRTATWFACVRRGDPGEYRDAAGRLMAEGPSAGRLITAESR